MMRVLSFLVGALACASCAIPGFTGTSYRFQGVAVYDQKPLADIQGGFDQLSVSPSGKRVAFQGRESLQDYALFIGDIGGTVHRLVKTGLEPSAIRWSADERTLTYITQLVKPLPPGTPAGVPPMPAGKAVFQLSVDGGEPRQVPGVGDYYAISPTADRAMVLRSTPPADGATPTAGGGLILVDLATGVQHAGPAEYQDVGPGAWSPDGQTVAFTCTRIDGAKRNTCTATALAASAEITWFVDAGDRGYPQHVSWASDGKTLHVFYLGANGELQRTATLPGTDTVEVASMPLGTSPVEGHPYEYQGTWYSPDGARVVLRRYVSVPVGIERSELRVPPENVVLDLTARTATVVTPDFQPVAWLSATSMLGFTGKDQDKRITVREL